MAADDHSHDDPQTTRHAARTPIGDDQQPSLHLSRRLVLGGATGAAAGLILTPETAGAATSASSDDFEHAGFNGLAAYVLPGDDVYSRRQGRTRPGPGGVAAGAAQILEKTYDRAVQVAVAPGLGITVPGAGGVVAVLAAFTVSRFALESAGPLAHPFANLTYARKGQILKDLDQQTLLQVTPLGYAFGTFITMAALASFAEGSAFDGGRLTGTPVGWSLTRYGGVSDGWPEYQGYWAGNRAVRDDD